MLRALAGLLAGIFAFACIAQEDAVIVTATRFADSKRDLPVGVSVITADDLRKSATSNLPEVLAQYGLLHIRDNSGSPNQQIDLRGFGVTGDQNTLILVDGLRLSENEQVPAQLSAIPLESIERIEIVRGSGAVLYGGGASGGTINIITKRGEDARRGYLLGRVGGWGTKEGRAGYAVQGDTLGFSLDASTEDTDGYRRNNNLRQTNVSGGVEARGGAGRGYVRFNGYSQELGLPGQLSEAQIRADPRQAATPNNESEAHGGTLVLGGAWKPGRHELAADLSRRERHSTSFFGPTLFSVTPSTTDTRAGVTALQPRAKLAFDALGRSHDVVLGIDWEQWDFDSRVTGDFPSLRTGEQTNQAVYAQANLWLAGRTRLVLGARSQRTEDHLKEEIAVNDDRRATHNLEAYEAALRQGLGAGWSAYGKYGRSFRVANFDDNACFFPPCATTLLKPQTALGGEVGLEYERAGWRARGAYYSQDLENEIYFSSLAGANINLQPTRRRGYELEAAWRIAPTLDLRASYAQMEAKFRSGAYGGVDVSGKDVPQVPDAIATAGIAWQFAARTRFVANARYVGAQRYDNDQDNTFRKQPDYTVADLKLEHTAGPFTLAVEVKNLFDEGYYSYGIKNFLGTSFDAYPAPGRAGYLTVAYRLP